MAKGRRIEWTGPALDDLRDIRVYVSRDDRLAAKRLAAKICESVERLALHPDSGRVVPELTALGLREVIVSPYRIVYRVDRSRIVILRVWHGRRQLPRD